MLKYILTRERDLLECFSTVFNSSISGNVDLYIYLLTKFKHNSESWQKHYKIFNHFSLFSATLLTFIREFKAWIQVTGCNKYVFSKSCRCNEDVKQTDNIRIFQKKKKNLTDKEAKQTEYSTMRWILTHNTLETCYCL